MTLDPEFSLKLATYRRKAADNTISLDEMREAVKLMRQGRVSAATASETARKRKVSAATPIDADAMLSELEGL
jgi:hypothetical protein